MIQCPNCGRLYTESGIRCHRLGYQSARYGKHGCDYLFSKKDEVIKDYESLSIRKISEKYSVREDLISDSLKFWGVHVLKSDSPRRSNIGKWIPFNINFFDDSNDSDDKFWLIGLLAADGSISGNTVSISQSGDSGYATIKYIKDILESDFDIVETETELNGSHNIAYTIRFSSKHVVEQLRKYNVVKSKTKIYTFPNCIPDRHIPHFICGYFEGDGCVGGYKIGGSNMYCKIQIVGTESFIQECDRRINIKHAIRKCSNASVWEITFNGKNGVLFCDWMYSSESIYKGSKKYHTYVECKEHLQNTNRYKCDLDKDRLLKYIQENGFVDVPKYYKANPEHHLQTYYDWLNKMVMSGLVLESQYKQNVGGKL